MSDVTRNVTGSIAYDYVDSQGHTHGYSSTWHYNLTFRVWTVGYSIFYK